MNKMNILRQFLYYFQGSGSHIFAQSIRHFLISIYGVLFAAVIGTPVGVTISRRRRLANQVIRLTNIIQAIPSLVMISILITGLGLGANVAAVTVFLYSLLPIIKNTYTGMVQVDKNILDVDKGMGMTVRQQLFIVELPLSVSVIMTGIRNTLVVAIGIAAIDAFAGADGLGDITIWGTNATEGISIILAGALSATLMAIITDRPLGILKRWLDPASRTSR